MSAGGSSQDEEALPPLSVQLAQQLGGVRGLVESSVPVVVFVVANVVGSLRPALAAAVATAVGLAAYRLSRRQSIRHAINGLFGILVGVAFAWKTGNAKDFYLPGIIFSLVYAVAMVVSVLVRHPLVGWLWSIVIGGGSTDWRREPRLVRTFSWLTLVWGSIYLLKVGVQTSIFVTDRLTDVQKASALGAARLALGYPPYLLLLALTVWAVRRAMSEIPDPVKAGAQPAAVAAARPAPAHRAERG